MTFLHPLALFGALLAIPIVLLYLRRSQQCPESVATAMLWQQAIKEDRWRNAWSRWRRGISLALQLTILASIVLAAAGPRLLPPGQFVVLVDNSPRGSAETDAASLTAAKAKAKNLVAGLRDRDRMAIISTGTPAAVQCSPTSDRSSLEAAIEQIITAAGPVDTKGAEALAQILPGDTPPGPAAGVWPEVPAWVALAAMAAVLLVVEWCLYQRRWII
jgi:hypothetical protein